PSAPRLAEASPEPRPPTAPPRLPDPVLPELQAPPAFELVMPTPEPELAPQTELRLPERFALPLPPPSPPAPPRQQPQPPRQAQPQTPPSRPSIPGGIWMPEGTQLGQPAVPQRQGRPDGGRGLDTSVAPRFLEARPSTSNSLRVLSGNAPQDWQAGFQRWVRQNLHFPLDAAARGEDGPVTVLLDIGVDGRVRRVTMVRPSTSPSLNRMTTWPFIDAQLPPLPAAGNADGLRLEFTARYVLIR
ncbi:MAG: energy transducer TonB, partial [Acetobacteraceae bacterium]|nr:energy transducer TonB [Acetobacteraceae bacterium]